jgi:glycosyltransferase involved in cell wall biosynthesis
MLFLLPGLGVGGAERQLVRVLQASRATLADVALTIVPLGPAADAPVVDGLKALGVPVAAVDRSDRSLPSFMRDLTRLIRHHRPHVVHAFLAGTPATWGRLAGRVAGAESVLYSDLSLDPRLTPLQRRMSPMLHRVTDAFLPNAESIARRLEREGADPARVHVVHNGVDTRAFDRRAISPASIQQWRQAWHAQDGDRVALFLGRLDATKRPHRLLDAVLATPESQRPARVVLMGSGPQRDTVRARIHEDGWLRRHAVQYDAVDDVASVLAASDVLVLPSRTEGLPNVVLEAMAAGTPVVASEVSDLGALLRGRGRSVPPQSLGALSRAMIETLAMPSEPARAQAHAARVYVQTHHDLEKSAQRFWDVHFASLKESP